MWSTPDEHFKVGQRVALHPATDLWMMGVRYGTVVKLGRKYVHIRATAGKGRETIYKMFPRDLEPV